MGASIDDICIVVKLNGAERYIQGTKDLGYLIWDVRLGLFDRLPNLDFSWLEDTCWGQNDACREIEARPENSRYGYVEVDFDRKLIADSSRYSHLNLMDIDWFVRSIQSRSIDDAIVPIASIKAHLGAGRLCLNDPSLTSQEEIDGYTVVLPSELDAALDELKKKTDEYHKTFIHKDRHVFLSLPQDWTFERVR